MAIGSFGIIRPSDVSPADVDIFYHYVADRADNSTATFKKLVATDVLTPVYHNANTEPNITADTEVLGGMYNLKLDSGDFSELGIYTLYLRPKQIRSKITDCGVLAAMPSVRGLVIDISANISSEDRGKFTPQGLIGYRIEYLDDAGKKISNFYRIITSSFYCEPVVSNLTNTTQKAIRYKYSDIATNLVFLTLTPSSSPTTKPNTIPYIGQPNQNIIFTNTYFDPVTIEIEMVEHDASTLAYALYGNQSKAVEKSIYTIYGKNNEIYKQYNLYEIKDEVNETLYEIREFREDIDESLSFDSIAE